MSARTHGWSAHNILWHTEGGALRAEFIQIPMWHFENLTGELRFREHVTDWYGVPLWDGGWLINSATPIGPAVALACCAKRMSLQDWMLFCERAATPGLLGKTNAAIGTQAWNDLCEMLRRWGRAWVGAVDKDTDITPVNLNTGTPPMPQLVERMDRAIAALYRGADLSTISKGEGLGASLQGEESDMLESDQCAEISEALHEQVDRFVIRFMCGDEEPLAYIWIEPVSKPDVESNTKIDDHLAKFGIRLSKRDMLQRYGRAEADGDADAVTMQQPAGEPGGAGGPFTPSNPAFGRLPNEATPATPLQTAQNSLQNASKRPGAQRAASRADAPEGVLRAFAEGVVQDNAPLAGKVKELLALVDAGKDSEAAAFAASLSANLGSYLPDDPAGASVLAEAIAERYGEAWKAARGENPAIANEGGTEDDQWEITSITPRDEVELYNTIDANGMKHDLMGRFGEDGGGGGGEAARIAEADITAGEAIVAAASNPNAAPVIIPRPKGLDADLRVDQFVAQTEIFGRRNQQREKRIARAKAAGDAEALKAAEAMLTGEEIARMLPSESRKGKVVATRIDQGQKMVYVDIDTPHLRIGAKRRLPSRKHRQGDSTYGVTTAFPPDPEFSQKKFRDKK